MEDRIISGRVYTVAGAESEVARLPSELIGVAPRGVATGIRLDLDCAASMGDGTVVLCYGRRLLRLGLDGRVSPWVLRDTAGGRTEFVAEHLTSAHDGSLLASTSVGKIYRITSDGTVLTLGHARLKPAPADGDYSVEDIASMPDGSVLVAVGFGYRVLRLAADGTVTTVAGNGRDVFGGDGGPAVDAGVGFPEAVVGLPDGGFLLAHSSPNRVRRIGPDGRINTVAGGGRGWREGETATSVKLRTISGLLAYGAGDVLMAGARGVLRLRSDGTISTVLPTTDNPTTDGLLAARAGVRAPIDVLAAPDGGLLVLDQLFANRRLLLVAPPMPVRLAVALPPRNRISLRRGRLTLTLTRAAAVSIRVRRGRRVVVRRSQRRFPAGRTTVRLRIPRSPLAHRVAVTARSTDGAVATHRLAFVASTRLSGTVVRRLMSAIAWQESDVGYYPQYECRRVNRKRFTCDLKEYDDFGLDVVYRNAERARLGADGLVHVGRSRYEPR